MSVQQLQLLRRHQLNPRKGTETSPNPLLNAAPLGRHQLNPRKGTETNGENMKQNTRNVLNRAYVSLQRIVNELYREVDRAIDNEDYADASLLEARAERIFEEAEAITVVIAEQENGR